MGLWTEHVVPRLTDASLSSAEVNRYRVEACAGLKGRVLEIGFGSGLNLPHLPPGVTAVDVVEPNEVAWVRSAQRRRATEIPVQRIGLDGQRIDADDATYDAAVATFVPVHDPGRGRPPWPRYAASSDPEARLHFLEHGVAPDPGVVRWQHRLDGLQQRLFGGCHLTRDVPALVVAAGLEITDLARASTSSVRG